MTPSISPAPLTVDGSRVEIAIDRGISSVRFVSAEGQLVLEVTPTSAALTWLGLFVPYDIRTVFLEHTREDGTHFALEGGEG